MFNVGDKVIEKETGDIGTITRRASQGDCWQDDYHRVWHVLWETGNQAGRELYLHENAMTLIPEVQKEKEYLEKIKQLEAEVKFLKGMLSNVQNW